MTAAGVGLSLAMLWTALGAAAVDSGWRYRVEGNRSYSTRKYLLVSNPGAPAELQFHVRSECRKAFPGEAPFGACSHRVTVRPGGKTIAFETGEQVALVYAGGTSPAVRPMLATVELGCCGAASKVRFYSMAGEYLGLLPTYAQPGPAMDALFDLGNVVDHALVLLLEPAPEKLAGEVRFVALRPDGAGFARERFTVDLRDVTGQCAWGFGQSFGAQDGRSMTLTLQLAECDRDKLELKCERGADGWACKR